MPLGITGRPKAKAEEKKKRENKGIGRKEWEYRKTGVERSFTK